MKPYYWESQHGNFGDDLNLWLWDFLLQGFREVHPETLLVGVGTVLSKALLEGTGHKLVLGSGFGYGSLPDMSDANEWDIRCVRGPLTAKKVGVDESLGIVDPAVMVADMPEYRNIPKTVKKSFVPHWESAVAGLWGEVCSTVGINYIDPRGDAKEVIADIARSELIIAESMHGAILADAFRVPWVAVSTSPSINSFKWNDWASTLGVTYRPRQIPVSTRAEAMLKGTRFWGVGFDAGQAPTANTSAMNDDGEVMVREQEPRVTGLRSAAKQMLAAPSTLALWQASRAEPQLSSDRALAERKERFLNVLDGVRRDYL
ncbi:succinoglycan biosynthesis protein ExoV [Pararhizobium capsulatum DSM 1112]|uniref:Succinoglycan biosynthesis protein ExoV n=1 Tax=Pararhizobium capsulatum DSM 1112 TaxID=1121113 RepID=A0ABU0BW69_9HYPH|nr:polysaccharide pyruvyl transferase family protein [Pararhizobium capsulatum]MDQ0322504.1 succinoglycan biosynthesis protein ExoV [Pararhizobium capsulatum DSM 1112]